MSADKERGAMMGVLVLGESELATDLGADVFTP